MKYLTLLIAVFSVNLPVISQKYGFSDKHGFMMKMLCAFMYLIVGIFAALSFGILTTYSVLILAALILGMLGDFFLEYNSKKLFLLGAVFFGLGHTVYSCTFLFVGNHKASDCVEAVAVITVMLTAIVMIFAKLKLKLTGKNKMLLIYAPVLIFSFACAIVKGVILITGGNIAFGICLLLGGVLFFASDIMIGIGKGGLERPAFLHNAVSYTYFTAQTLFALSILFQ